MDIKTAAEMLKDNLPAIYGYAVRNLYESGDAEDMAQDIVCEVLESIKNGNLNDDRAFWGYVWATAKNILRVYIRREEQRKKHETAAEKTFYQETIIPSPEDGVIDASQNAEDIYLIRRELSLLSKTRREVSVRYYIRNKSCSEISEELNISVEAVKYHLFKARAKMKEGYYMERKLGRKSYDPGRFKIDFWGDWNHYSDFFNRKILGAIALAAYYAPVSAEELSVELGVAMPYLEDEIEALLAAGVLQKIGGKYQTNIVILTAEYEKEADKKLTALVSRRAEEIFEDIKKTAPEVRKLDFSGKNYDDNRLLFMLLNIAVVNGFIYAHNKSPLGNPQPLKLGGHGWIFGHDSGYDNSRFMGVTLHTEVPESGSWFSAENYRAIGKCQLWNHWQFSEKTKLMISAIDGKRAENLGENEQEQLEILIDGGFITVDGGVMRPEFPVFSEAAYNELTEKYLNPAIEKVGSMMIDASGACEKILVSHAPASVRGQCGTVAKIHHRLETGAILLETLMARGDLALPAGKVPLCTFGVKADI